MSDYSLIPTGSQSDYELPAEFFKRPVCVVLDFSVYNMENTETIDIINLPAKTLIKVLVDRVTSEGGAATIDLATDESSPQTILNDASINGTGFLFGDGADGDAAALEFITVEDCTLVLTANTAGTDTAKLNIHIVAVPLVGPLTAS